MLARRNQTAPARNGGVADGRRALTSPARIRFTPRNGALDMKRTIWTLTLLLGFATAACEDDDDDDDAGDGGSEDTGGPGTTAGTSQGTSMGTTAGSDPTVDPSDPTADPTVDPSDPTMDPTADPTAGGTGDPTGEPTHPGCDNIVVPCPVDHGNSCSNNGDCQSGVCDCHASITDCHCSVLCDEENICPADQNCEEVAVDGFSQMANVCV
jgi:hypothetical protein